MDGNARSRWGLLLTAALLTACATDEEGPREPTATPEQVAQAAEAIDAEELLANVSTLASDEFEGRAPGGVGEEKTVAFLTEKFQALGLEPGNPDGTWVQQVSLIGYTPTAEAEFQVNGRTITPSWPDDYTAVSRRMQPSVSVDGSELVFVGYGVDAPEYGWDDYKGQDMTGKTLVVLVNDPAVADSANPDALDESMFKGETMTYYGRWSYKYEVGAEKGADAVIVVHETGPAGYPYEVVRNGWTGESFDIPAASLAGRLAVEAWITEPMARRLVAAAGQDFDQLKEAARRSDFQPVPLNGTASFTVETETREVESRNVVARLAGSQLEDEYVVYTAHWDHLGKDTTLTGDQIYNGALDNATGTAGLIELAKAFTALPTPPARSILFLAVTAEEQGLLGAKHYAANPLYPLEKTAANINIDGLNQWGSTEDVVVVGLGNSQLDDIVVEEAAAVDRRVVPDPEPEKGFYYRSDHFAFAKEGVPALYTDAGVSFIGQEAGYGEGKREEYTANDYHKPSDEVKDDWDLSGAVDDLRLLFRVGWRVAEAEAFPEWKEGTEFKATREERLRAAGAR
ncbi:MAG TPA: M28 family metallopeptidase [Longimicrobiales bacterium]|nr:M28 family metallopeptidase [Longimicrobiales bacterium]